MAPGDWKFFRFAGWTLAALAPASVGRGVLLVVTSGRGGAASRNAKGVAILCSSARVVIVVVVAVLAVAGVAWLVRRLRMRDGDRSRGAHLGAARGPASTFATRDRGHTGGCGSATHAALRPRGRA